MGSARKCFRQLQLPLVQYNQEIRKQRLENIYGLFNFRVRTTGISQIKSVFYSWILSKLTCFLSWCILPKLDKFACLSSSNRSFTAHASNSSKVTQFLHSTDSFLYLLFAQSWTLCYSSIIWQINVSKFQLVLKILNGICGDNVLPYWI